MSSQGIAPILSLVRGSVNAARRMTPALVLTKPFPRAYSAVIQSYGQRK